ncbi:hypothetical protein B7463_g3919, partial [Scytalidium lignicola]
MTDTQVLVLYVRTNSDAAGMPDIAIVIAIAIATAIEIQTQTRKAAAVSQVRSRLWCHQDGWDGGGLWN